MGAQQDGPGVSKVALTSAQQDEIRRSKKQKQKHGTGRSTQPAKSITELIREDKAARRIKFKRGRFFATVWGHIRVAGTRKNWSREQFAEAESILREFVFGEQEYDLSCSTVEYEVRRRFALGFARDERAEALEMLGARLDNFDNDLAKAKKFAEERSLIPAQRTPDEAMANA